ncbi:pre-peptidase C-terminal domain-containing protein [Singulisphaera sp. GP187]|uniref:PPC domain-containing protein n=1 Tax=Singulisphaera sp. GP187 TaxID=1882752 RepID=UPI000927353E|nr:PPC domain-containing protein [Singulisphaera sp. GP187]SIN86852.1 pre-peptidase C-terminal domain-containing protein [Singulisphaera sp. GP187]
MPRPHWIAAALALLLAPELARAQTSYPMLTRVTPTAARRGETVEITIVGGGRFDGAWQLLCEGPGLAGTVLDGATPPAGDPKAMRRGGRTSGTVKASVTIAPDAPLGPREIRVATPQGISSVGLIVVVDDRVVTEADDAANDRPESAQALELPAVVSGLIGKTEDVDWYSFSATAGQTLTFSVWANRLENKIHDLQTHFDPILAIHDAQGRELAVDDNHDFADPLLSYKFKDAGTYRLQIRDTTYTGNANWTYVLHATGGPVATSLFPLAVNPGTSAVFEARGANLDATQKTLPLEIPANLKPGVQLMALPTERGTTLPVPLLSTPLPLALEVGDAPAEIEKGQAVSLPVALSGRLLEPNDIDTYRFDAKKGQIYAFEVVARRAGTATDPVLRIVNLKNVTQAEADDSPGSKDPRLEWTAPADESYAVQVLDLHSRGGEGFGYVLLAEPATPGFSLSCDPDKLNLGPGARVPLFVQVARRAGFNGPVAIAWEGLPKGVTASPLTIPANMTQGVSVVSAASDAAPAAALLRISGQAEIAGKAHIETAEPKQEIYLPGGGRGLYPVQTIALAVTTESDITVEATPAALTLVPGKTATIDVTVTRHNGYNKGVNLAILLQHLGGTFANPLPPGVSIKEAGSKTLLGPTETHGKIILEAKPDAAPCDKTPVAVMGHVSINFVVKTAYSSAPISLTIPPKASQASK